MRGIFWLKILLNLWLPMTNLKTAVAGQGRRFTVAACNTMIFILEVLLEEPILTDRVCAERCDEEKFKLKKRLDWKTDAETMLSKFLNRAKKKDIQSEMSPHYYIDQCLAQRRYCTSLKASYLKNTLRIENSSQDSTSRITYPSKLSCSQSQPFRCLSDRLLQVHSRQCFCQVNLALLQVWSKPIEEFSVPGFEGCELQDICQRLNKRRHIEGPKAPWKCSGGFVLPTKVKCMHPLRACPCNFHFLQSDALRVDQCTDWSLSDDDKDSSSASMTADIATSRSVSPLDEELSHFANQLEDMLSGDELQANQLDALPRTILKPKISVASSSSSEGSSQMHKDSAKPSAFFCSDLVMSALPSSSADNRLTLRPADLATSAHESINLDTEVSRIPLQMPTSSIITSDFTLEALDESIAAVGVDLDNILSVMAEEAQHQADALPGLTASAPQSTTCDVQTSQKRKFDQLGTRGTLPDAPFSGSIDLTSVPDYPSDVFPESHLFSNSIDHSATYGVFVPEGSEITASEQSALDLANLLDPAQHSTNVEKDAQEIWEEFLRRGIP